MADMTAAQILSLLGAIAYKSWHTGLQVDEGIDEFTSGSVATLKAQAAAILAALNSLPEGAVPVINALNSDATTAALSAAMGKALNTEKLDIPANTLPGQVLLAGSGTATQPGPYPCNPNLLDNWYFGNPVNQRGQASYSDSGYAIDRWKVENVTYDVGNHSVAFQNTAGTDCKVYQAVGTKTMAQGTPLLFSVLVDGKLYSLDCVFGQYSHGATDFGYMIAWFNDMAYPIVELRFNGSGTAILQAAKLELGSVQTLAHQEDGVWVLNEVPDYGEQLAKCQRYLYPIFDTNSGVVSGFTSSSGSVVYLTVPCKMLGSNPEIIGGLGTSAYAKCDGTNFMASTITGLSVYSFGPDAVVLSANVSGSPRNHVITVAQDAISKTFIQTTP